MANPSRFARERIELIQQNCQGCGARIQHEDSADYGFVPESLLDRRPLLCQRCFRINHYGRDDLGPVQADDSLVAIREGLRWAEGVVLVVDLVDLEASLSRPLVDLIAAKKTILVVNKVDLLPPQTPLHEVETWVRDRLRAHGLVQTDLHLVSALNGFGFEKLLAAISQFVTKALFVGATNVGKSSVLQRLLQMKTSGGLDSILPTVSSFPGTTVQISRWVLSGGLLLADSPGYVPYGRVSDLVGSECTKKLIPARQLVSHLYSVGRGDIVYIAGLCAVECIDVTKPGLLLGFTGSGVRWSKSTRKHLDKWLAPAGPCEIASWAQRAVNLGPGEDLVISGLGWVSARKASYQLSVHLPEQADLRIRPNLIGRKGKNKE